MPIFFPPAKYYLSLRFYSSQDFTSFASSQKTSHRVPWKGCFRCPHLCVGSGATAASMREGQDRPCCPQLLPHRAHHRTQLSPALTLLLSLENPIRKGKNTKLQWGTKHEEKPYNVKLRRRSASKWCRCPKRVTWHCSYCWRPEGHSPCSAAPELMRAVKLNSLCKNSLYALCL